MFSKLAVRDIISRRVSIHNKNNMTQSSRTDSTGRKNGGPHGEPQDEGPCGYQLDDDGDVRKAYQKQCFLREAELFIDACASFLKQPVGYLYLYPRILSKADAAKAKPDAQAAALYSPPETRRRPRIEAKFTGSRTFEEEDNGRVEATVSGRFSRSQSLFSIMERIATENLNAPAQRSKASRRGTLFASPETRGRPRIEAKVTGSRAFEEEANGRVEAVGDNRLKQLDNCNTIVIGC